MQSIIKGSPKGFSDRTGCPHNTAKKYSNGTNSPPKWMKRIIRWAINRGYDIRESFSEEV